MLRAHYQLLTYGCLLTLHNGEAIGCALTEALRQALRSSHHSVWVDCRHISMLSSEAVQLLNRCAACLWRHGGHLIVHHLPAQARLGLAPSPERPLAASLLDGDLYGLPCPEDPTC